MNSTNFLSLSIKRTAQEFIKLFPQAPQDEHNLPFEEIKCGLNERTGRGILYITNTSLYFYSKMLGETKIQIPFEQIQSIQLSPPSVDRNINIKTSNTEYKFLAFHNDIQSAFTTIESTWNKINNPVNNEPEPEPEPKIEQKEVEKAPEDSTPIVDNKDDSEGKSEEKLEESKEVTSKPKKTNNIRDMMRKRQAQSHKQQTEAVAKIKEKATESRQKVEKQATIMGSPKGSFELLFRFLTEFGSVLVLLWICSFVMPSSVTVVTWRGLFACSIIISSLQVVLCLKEISNILTNALVPKIGNNVPTPYIRIGSFFVVKIILLIVVGFLIPEVEINGIIGFILIVLGISAGDVARVVLEN